MNSSVKPAPEIVAMAPAPLITLKDVTLKRDHRLILEDVNFKVYPGDFVAITGPNGGGKTTLLRIILGLLPPTSGIVNVSKGVSIGYLPQKNMIDSHFPISVREVVESGLLATKGISRDDKASMVRDTIERIQLTEHADRPIGQLSGGQLQRALLGRAIISKPKLLVLDEPLSYLDKRFEHRLYDIIADLAKEATILLVSHEMTTIAGMANRHLIIDHRLHECTAAHHYVRTECE